MFNSISKKILAGYAAIFIMLAIESWLLYEVSNDIAQQNQRYTEEILPSLRAIENVNQVLTKVQLDAFGLYGTTLELEDFQQRFADNQEQLSRLLKQIGRMKSPGELENQKMSLLDSVQGLQQVMASRPIDWDGARNSLTNIQQEMNKTQELTDSVKKMVEQQAEKASQIVSDGIAQIRVDISVSAVLIVIIIGSGLLISRRTIAEPIKNLSTKLDSIAATSDLREQIAVNSQDEIGTVADSVNKLLGAFKNGTQDVQSSASNLKSSVETLNESAKMADEQVLTFSQNIKELTAKITTLEDCIDETASRSSNASELAGTGAEQVQSGVAEVTSTSNSIAALAQDIDKSAEILLGLKNAGDQVSSVVKSIADIAEQTNLLALNAAIEAARAGESGRGFAVVADEVRTLASRTHDSTSEINKILDTIVTSISSTVTSMDSNKEKANEAVAMAQSTVGSLDAIKQTVLGLSKENKELSDLGQHIKMNASAMRGSVDKIDDASHHVTESSTDIRDAADSLSNMSSTLNDVVSRFKV